MTRKEDNKIKEILQEAIEEDGDFIKKLLGRLLQELLEYERDLQIGVEKYERDDGKRQGTRNGYKSRWLNTRMGKISLNKPQIREFPFKTCLFDNYQRSEKALIAALQQMVIDGVSTAKVKKITRKLASGLTYSKSTVSRITKELDPLVEKWRKSKLDEHYEYIMSDAIYLPVRENGEVINRPIMISIGIDSDGHRKILGIDLMYQEDEVSWKSHLENLKRRGIESTSLTISDANRGLVKALEEELQAPHQRCTAHFERNVLSKVPYKERKSLGKAIKQIYNAPNKKMALQIAGIIADEYRSKYSRVSKMLEDNLESTLTFYSCPENHRRRIRTTNLIETLNRLVKKRTKVINVFPNAESCIRYVSCLLMEIDEDWQTGRRYMRMDCLEEPDNKKTEKVLKQINNVKNKNKKNKEVSKA